MLYMDTCDGIDGAAPYENMMDCLDTCDTWDAGTTGDTTGNTLACRLYHVGAAADDPNLHCPHASADGGGQCV